MERDLGLDVEAFFATDYAGVIEAMRGGHVDLAWFGNKAAIEAVDRADGEVFAQMVDGDGHAGYWSVLVTTAAGRLKDIDALFADPASYSIGVGDPNSTSGYLVPLAELFGPRGIDPKRAFGRVLAANHESNALAVALGHVDAASVDSKVLRRLAVSHPNEAKKLRELWRSSLIPSDTICWRRALPDDVRARIAEWFFVYGSDDAERAVLAALDLDGFRASSDAQLLPIRRLELVKDRLRVEADASLSTGSRQVRLADIELRFEELDARSEATKSGARSRGDE